MIGMSSSKLQSMQSDGTIVTKNSYWWEEFHALPINMHNNNCKMCIRTYAWVHNAQAFSFEVHVYVGSVYERVNQNTLHMQLMSGAPIAMHANNTILQSNISSRVAFSVFYIFIHVRVQCRYILLYILSYVDMQCTAEFAMRVRDTLPHPRKIFVRLGYA